VEIARDGGLREVCNRAFERCWIERDRDMNVIELPRFCHVRKNKWQAVKLALFWNGRPCRDRTYDQRIKSPLQEILYLID
jgi:hypothetical protein